MNLLFEVSESIFSIRFRISRELRHWRVLKRTINSTKFVSNPKPLTTFSSRFSTLLNLFEFGEGAGREGAGLAVDLKFFARVGDVKVTHFLVSPRSESLVVAWESLNLQVATRQNPYSRACKVKRTIFQHLVQ